MIAGGTGTQALGENCYNVSMKKWIVTALACIGAAAAWAQVSVISVTDENKHATKEDFSHTFEYYIIPAGRPAAGGKCQATRIGRRWFVTAAHCVTPLCDKGCTLAVDLLEQPLSARAEVSHTVKKPAVFVHPGYMPGSLALNDVALFRLDLDRTPLSYYRRGAQNVAVSAQTFAAFLNKNRQAASQLKHIQSPSFPPLVLFGQDNYVVQRTLSVISIFGGKRQIKKNPHPVHYVNELGFAYTENFGVIQGMSGSGVMTNTGELIGIISGNLTLSRPGQNKASKPQEFFMFPVFNRRMTEFMQDAMGSDYYKLDWKDAYPSVVRKSRQNYREMTEIVRGLSVKKGK